MKDYFNEFDKEHFDFDTRNRGRRKHYEPWFDDRADYNTNAPSYYDFLARFRRYVSTLTDFVNELLNRDVQFQQSASVDFTKLTNWEENPVLTFQGHVRITKTKEEKTFLNQNFSLDNALHVYEDGLYAPDLTPLLEKLNEKIDAIPNLENRVQTLENENRKLQNALQKIIDNLHASGAISNKDLTTFVFEPNRNIASGNINIFGGLADGTSFIRTSNEKQENDIVAGMDG